MFRVIALLLTLILALGCGKENEVKSKVKQLPFDEFWLSTKFGNTPPNEDPLYFNTWAVFRPHNTAETFYHYYASDNFQGIVPAGCSRSFDYLPENLVYAKVSCKLQLKGNLKPNELEWLSEINYTAEITANIQTLKVTSAKITFTDYDQVIDFTDSNPEVFYHSVNGYLELHLGGGDFLVKTTDNHDLYVRCVFSKVGG